MIARDLPQKSHIYVAADGSADYATIQAAVDAVPENNTGDVIIHIKPGVYAERVKVSAGKRHIMLEGDSADNTKITFDEYAGKVMENGDITGTFRSGTVSVYANYFSAKNITFENSYDNSKGGSRQALALYASGEHLVFENCKFYGAQDTLYAKDGTQYYYKCYIEGDVDFIFGGARAVFEECEIFARNPNPEDQERKAYITAPSTPISQKFGFLITKCQLTGNFADNSVYLGRPWHPGADPLAIGSCLFTQCEMSSQIREDGWKEQMGGFLSMNARLYEYDNVGPGVHEHERRRVLSSEQAAEYTKEHVLGWF